MRYEPNLSKGRGWGDDDEYEQAATHAHRPHKYTGSGPGDSVIIRLWITGTSLRSNLASEAVSRVCGGCVLRFTKCLNISPQK